MRPSCRTSFRVHKVGTEVSVIVEARGGTVGSAGARNTQYAEGLALLLQRLKAHDMRIADALVESRETAELAAEDRRILGPKLQYPLVIIKANDQVIATANISRGREVYCFYYNIRY